MNKRYMSKKDFGEDRTNVGYALYVRENLKPNDYFKTNTGEIYKSMNVSPISNGKIYYANGEYCWVNESAVINFSPNIIDLIEVGDYVNGSKVMNIVEEDGTKYLVLDRDEVYYDSCLEPSSDKDIKSIVTKEMFESMQYKVD